MQGSRGYAILIRGPLGVGKTTVSKRLAQALGAGYISIDAILDNVGLWEEGALEEFVRANGFAAAGALATLAQGVPVVIDGNFYWQEQIDDLWARLPYAHHAFTLVAPLSVCVARDAARIPSHGAEATRQVYEKTKGVECGARIDTTGPIESIVRDIVTRVATERARADAPSPVDV